VEPRYFYAAPAPDKKFDAVAQAAAPTLLHTRSKPTFLQTKVNIKVATFFSSKVS
jgi:hypothetical protein